MAVKISDVINGFRNLIVKNVDVMTALGIPSLVILPTDTKEVISTKSGKINNYITYSVQFDSTNTPDVVLTITNSEALSTYASTFERPQFEVTIIYKQAFPYKAWSLHDELKKLFVTNSICDLDLTYEGTSPQVAISNDQEKMSMRFSLTSDVVYI